MQLSRLFVFVLFILHYSPVIHGAVDIYVDGFFWNSIRATGLRLKDKNFHIEGRLIRAIPFSGCSSLENKDYIQQLAENDTVIVVTSTKSSGLQNCAEEVRLRHVKETGAVAMLYASDEYAAGYGINAYAINAEPQVQKVDIVGIDMKDDPDLDKILKDLSKIVTVIIEDDPNLWWENRQAFTAVTVLLEIATFGILGMIVLRLSQFIKKYGAQPSIPQVCLWLELVGSLMRILYYVDPSFCRGVWNFSFAAFLNFTQLVWFLSAALLLTFYWEEVMRAAHIQAFPQLAKMKIPALISITLLFILAVLCAIIRSQHINAEAAAINTVIQLLYTTPVAIFFCYGGIRILRNLYQTKSLSKRSENLRKVTLMLVGIAACFSVMVLFLLIFLIAPFSIGWFMANRIIVWTAQTVEAFCLVMSFQDPNASNSSGSISPNVSSKPRTLSSVTLEPVV